MSEGINRRELLGKAWKTGAGLLGLAGAWTVWDAFKPGPIEGFGGVVKAGFVDDVPATDVKAVQAIRGYVTEVEGEVVALSWKCPHLGCRVPYCESSGWFECPCHGSKFNRVGEWQEGPAPHGMDRYPVTVENGIVQVDTGAVETGPQRGSQTLDEPLRGPHCGEAGHA